MTVASTAFHRGIVTFRSYTFYEANITDGLAASGTVVVLFAGMGTSSTIYNRKYTRQVTTMLANSKHEK